MKKITAIIFLSILLLNANFANAQKRVATTKSIKKEPIKLLRTNQRSVAIMANFLSPAIKASILKQISVKEYNDFMMYCNEEDYPSCIKAKLEYNPANPDADVSEVTLKSLKLYRIAKFRNLQNGKDFGENSILVALAKENKDVGGDCNFDQDFYIIVPSKDIEIIK